MCISAGGNGHNDAVTNTPRWDPKGPGRRSVWSKNAAQAGRALEEKEWSGLVWSSRVESKGKLIATGEM